MLYTTKLKPILSNPAKIFSFPLAISKQMCYNNTVICRGIEVVITGLTRNQFVLTHTRVRIPPSAPKQKALKMLIFLVFSRLFFNFSVF